ncbi:Nif11-like leader peptide family RiPP precursor [Parabacteroides sp.]
MTLQEFIEKVKTDEALKAKVDAAVMEKVILPMAQAEGVELSEEELNGIAGGSSGFDKRLPLRPAFHF